MEWTSDTYTLKRQVLALTGKIRLYTPDERLCAYSEQAMFRLREDIRVYADEYKQSLLLTIQARQVIDFAASYDVSDPAFNRLLGTLRRRGFQSMLRDRWEILGPAGDPLAMVEEDTGCRAALRRFLLGSLLPQTYYIRLADGTIAATFTQRFHLFRYEMELAFHLPPERFERRFGISAAILLAVIEGKQSDS